MNTETLKELSEISQYLKNLGLKVLGTYTEDNIVVSAAVDDKRTYELLVFVPEIEDEEIHLAIYDNINKTTVFCLEIGVDFAEWGIECGVDSLFMFDLVQKY